jgi:hypothetical protein
VKSVVYKMNISFDLAGFFLSSRYIAEVSFLLIIPTSRTNSLRFLFLLA